MKYRKIQKTKQKIKQQKIKEKNDNSCVNNIPLQALTNNNKKQNDKIIINFILIHFEMH